MKKSELNESVNTLKAETHDALQLIIDELNHGQRQKLVKGEKVKELLDRYEVTYER